MQLLKYSRIKVSKYASYLHSGLEECRCASMKICISARMQGKSFAENNPGTSKTKKINQHTASDKEQATATYTVPPNSFPQNDNGENSVTLTLLSVDRLSGGRLQCQCLYRKISLYLYFKLKSLEI